MRLGQLARHIVISPSEILDFLQSRGFTCEGGTNARLTEEQIRTVLQKFSPERIGEVVSLVAEQDKPETVETIGKTQGESNLDAGPSPVAETLEAPESAETIRAPKIELQGLKVVGKIDLPEPRKKQVDRAPEPPLGHEEKSKPYRGREQRPQRTWINPLEKQRMREAREAEERKRKLAEQRKEVRTAAYLSRQEKIKANSRLKQKSSSRMEEEIREARVKKPKPTSFFGKLWYWLTNAD